MRKLSELCIQSEFYEPETRDGFFVCGLMKRAWAVQLEILSELDRICRLYNIRWYADWDTLLGTVRHGGFVPWDDDIDVCMLRKDYDKFLEIVDKELRDDYNIVQPFDSRNIMRGIVSRLVNTTSVNFNDEYLKKSHGFPYICGVDIFPLDYVSGDVEEWEMHKNISILVGVTEKEWDNMTNEERAVRLEDIESICEVGIDREGDIRRQLIVLLDALARSGADESSPYITSVSQAASGLSKKPFLKSWYDGIEYLSFEGIAVPVPRGYMEVLECLYGETYMTPIIGASGHDYPFFLSQKEDVQRYLKVNKGYENRENYVADMMGMQRVEVCEYKLIERGEKEDAYLYFCQSRMIIIHIPHGIEK